MRLTGQRDPLRFNRTGCVFLPLATFAALMLATAGTAVWPKLAAPGAAILCGAGELVYESHGASYRPGEYTITRDIYCQTGAGKQATRDNITFQAMAVSFLVYALVFFLLMRFVLWPLSVRRFRRKVGPQDLSGPPAAVWPDTPATPGPGDILARVQEAVQRGDADVRVSTAAVDVPDADTGADIAARLARLKALRDQGLITARDYDAKKAEILAGL